MSGYTLVFLVYATQYEKTFWRSIGYFCLIFPSLSFDLEVVFVLWISQSPRFEFQIEWGHFCGFYIFFLSGKCWIYPTRIQIWNYCRDICWEMEKTAFWFSILPSNSLDGDRQQNVYKSKKFSIENIQFPQPFKYKVYRFLWSI